MKPEMTRGQKSLSINYIGPVQQQNGVRPKLFSCETNFVYFACINKQYTVNCLGLDVE